MDRSPKAARPPVPSTAPRHPVWWLGSLVASLVATAAVAASSPANNWINDYIVVATRASADCEANVLEECRAELRRLGELTDGRPDFRCRLARIDAELGAADVALEDLSLCIRSGLAFKDLATDPKLASVRALSGYASVEQASRRQAAPATGYTTHLALTDPNLIAEDVAYDPSRCAFYVSSVRERKIVQVGANGTTEDFITAAQTPMWGAYALAVDSARGVLWATTIASAESPPFEAKDEGASAVLKFDLRTRALLARYELHDGRHHGFGDVTLTANGELFVSDGIDGGVYRVANGDRSELRTVVAAGAFRSPQTPALVAGTGRLLVPDYSRGIAVVNLRGGDPSWLPHPPELALFGIDGLYLDGRTLIAIQNGTVPERVLVMTLDPACTRIIDWRAVVAHVPALGDPTHGTFVGSQFYFIANSGWDRVKDDGSLGGEATAAQLWKLTIPTSGKASRAACQGHSG